MTFCDTTAGIQASFRKLTQDAYFSLLTHTKQLLLVTFCDTLAGIEVSFGADGTGRMEPDGRNHGRMDRQTWKLK